MSEKKKNTLRAIFYILLGMSLAGTLALIILYSVARAYSASCDTDLLYEPIRRIYVLFSLENGILYLYCLISLILAGKNKLINSKMILLIIFAILSSPVVYHFIQNTISSINSSFHVEWNGNGGVDAKPMLYVYPKEDMDLTIKLKNDNLITYSYPKYKN